MILFSSSRRRERIAAGQLYAATAQAARSPALFLAFGVPDTLQGRFEMLTLHLFPLLHRLMHDPGDDPELARQVSEAFVNDMDAAMREMGVGDVTVPKRMKKLYASFAGRISAYKSGLEAGPDSLTAAVARNVFADEAPDSRPRELTLYLIQAVAMVRGEPLDALRHGKLRFPPPEDASEGKTNA